MLNSDLTNPSNSYAEGIPIHNKYLEDGSVPIFWGDNQTLDEESLEYTRPSGMEGIVPLHVPKVVRFLYTYGELDEIDDPDDPDPEITHYLWHLVEVRPVIVPEPGIILDIPGMGVNDYFHYYLVNLDTNT